MTLKTADGYEPKFQDAFRSVFTAMVTDNSGKHELECQMCGHTFHAKREDAKYCSDVCRKGASRRKEQLRRASRNAQIQINFIKSQMEKFPELAIVGGLELEKIIANCDHRRQDR
jgi:hypothetical protein